MMLSRQGEHDFFAEAADFVGAVTEDGAPGAKFSPTAPRRRLALGRQIGGGYCVKAFVIRNQMKLTIFKIIGTVRCFPH